MNKKDVQGIVGIIKNNNAIIKIYKAKHNVRIVRVNFEEGDDLVVTGCTLKNALQKTSKILQGEKRKEICVQGIPSADSVLDAVLDNGFVILSKSTHDSKLANLSLFNNNKELVFVATAPAERSVLGLFEKAEEYLTNNTIEM